MLSFYTLHEKITSKRKCFVHFFSSVLTFPGWTAKLRRNRKLSFSIRDLFTYEWCCKR